MSTKMMGTQSYQTAPVVLSDALSPERILLFFGRESPFEIIEWLSRTFERLNWEYILNAVRANPAHLMSSSVQVLYARLPGLRETQAALALSRMGNVSLSESQVRVHAILMILSPLGDRFIERAFLRKVSRLFAASQDLDVRLSKLLSVEAVLDAIRAAEVMLTDH